MPGKIHDQLLERTKAHVSVDGVEDIFCLDGLCIIEKSLDVESLRLEPIADLPGAGHRSVKRRQISWPVNSDNDCRASGDVGLGARASTRKRGG